jgi:hypothetical protein
MADASPTVLTAADVTARTGTAYPAQYALQLRGREKRVCWATFSV